MVRKKAASIWDSMPPVSPSFAIPLQWDVRPVNWYTLSLLVYIIPDCCPNDTLMPAVQHTYGDKISI